MTDLRLGTRGSPLALAQAAMVRAALVAAHGLSVEIVPIVTTGDRVQDRPLAEIGGKALWTKELDAALLDGRIDCAVHSMKDVETQLAAGIAIAAMLPRADVRDRLIGAASIAALRPGAVVGTSSPRRAAQLRHRRPDLQITGLRGNVATRLAQVEAGTVDATLLAAAGLDRLGIDAGSAIEGMLPAPAQGAVGITARADDARVKALLKTIDHRDTHKAVAIERQFLELLGADCHSSVAALATRRGDAWRFEAEILLPDGSERHGRGFQTPDDVYPDQQKLVAMLLGAASPALRALFDPT